MYATLSIPPSSIPPSIPPSVHPPPSHPPPPRPLLQSSLEVIISQNDNALGVFSLTETNFALNDDDRSSVMVTISRTGGQLDGVTVCLQTYVHMISSTTYFSPFYPPTIAFQVAKCSTCFSFILASPPLLSPPLLSSPPPFPTPPPTAGVECRLHQPAATAGRPQQSLCGDKGASHLFC